MDTLLNIDIEGVALVRANYTARLLFRLGTRVSTVFFKNHYKKGDVCKNKAGYLSYICFVTKLLEK